MHAQLSQLRRGQVFWASRLPHCHRYEIHCAFLDPVWRLPPSANLMKMDKIRAILSSLLLLATFGNKSAELQVLHILDRPRFLRARRLNLLLHLPLNLLIHHEMPVCAGCRVNDLDLILDFVFAGARIWIVIAPGVLLRLSIYRRPINAWISGSEVEVFARSSARVVQLVLTNQGHIERWYTSFQHLALPDWSLWSVTTFRPHALKRGTMIINCHCHSWLLERAVKCVLLEFFGVHYCHKLAIWSSYSRVFIIYFHTCAFERIFIIIILEQWKLVFQFDVLYHKWTGSCCSVFPFRFFLLSRGVDTSTFLELSYTRDELLNWS